MNDFSQRQQFRTYFEIFFAGGVGIDFEADFGSFAIKINDATAVGESRGFADGQDGLGAELGQNIIEAPCFRIADENDLAIREIFGAARLLDDHRPPMDGFAANSFRQVLAKGIAAQNADLERFVGVGERSFRPGDELREVKKERRFDLVFLGLTLQCSGREQRQQHTQKQHPL